MAIIGYLHKLLCVAYMVATPDNGCVALLCGVLRRLSALASCGGGPLRLAARTVCQLSATSLYGRAFPRCFRAMLCGDAVPRCCTAMFCQNVSRHYRGAQQKRSLPPWLSSI